MTIFQLAILEVKRENKINNKNAGKLIIERAYTIRKYLDIAERNKKVAGNRYYNKKARV